MPKKGRVKLSTEYFEVFKAA